MTNSPETLRRDLNAMTVRLFAELDEIRDLRQRLEATAEEVETR